MKFTELLGFGLRDKIKQLRAENDYLRNLACIVRPSGAVTLTLTYPDGRPDDELSLIAGDVLQMGKCAYLSEAASVAELQKTVALQAETLVEQYAELKSWRGEGFDTYA